MQLKELTMDVRNQGPILLEAKIKQLVVKTPMNLRLEKQTHKMIDY